jgi:hypothetical protein
MKGGKPGILQVSNLVLAVMQVIVTVIAFEIGTTFDQATASSAGAPPDYPGRLRLHHLVRHLRWVHPVWHLADHYPQEGRPFARADTSSSDFCIHGDQLLADRCSLQPYGLNSSLHALVGSIAPAGFDGIQACKTKIHLGRTGRDGDTAEHLFRMGYSGGLCRPLLSFSTGTDS